MTVAVLQQSPLSSTFFKINDSVLSEGSYVSVCLFVCVFLSAVTLSVSFCLRAPVSLSVCRGFYVSVFLSSAPTLTSQPTACLTDCLSVCNLYGCIPRSLNSQNSSLSPSLTRFLCLHVFLTHSECSAESLDYTSYLKKFNVCNHNHY